MKKSLIALAVAGAMTVPAIASADATLYGSFRMALDKTENKSASFGDYGSRVGIRGTVDLGLDGTKGIFNWETDLNTDDDNSNGLGNVRYASMGATGDWGTAVGGRIDHFTWNYGGSVTDIFVSGNGKILSVNYGNNLRAAVGGESRRFDRRVNNTLAYVSPNISGLTVGGGMVVAGDVIDKDKQVDGYNLGAKYDIAGLTLGAGYGAIKTAKAAQDYLVDQNLWSLSAAYKLDALTLTGVYEQSKDKAGATSVKDKGYSLAGRYEVDGLGATLAYSRAKQDNRDAGKRWQAEVYNRMGRGIVAAGYVDNNSKARGGVDDQFYVSYRLDF